MDSPRSHIVRIRVVLADTDAAGVVYFSRAFDLAHRCYEDMMEARGLPLKDVLATGRYALPIVAASAELSRPMRLGEELDVEVQTEEVGERSYRLAYRLRGPQTSERLGAAVATTHVAVDLATGKVMPLPAEVRAVLDGS